MPPLIYPHRANGRGSIPVVRHYRCRKWFCGHYFSTSSRTVPECPRHKIPMRRAR